MVVIGAGETALVWKSFLPLALSDSCQIKSLIAQQGTVSLGALVI